MPKGRFADVLTERLEQLTTSLFLPMFFVYSGLNTKVGLLNTMSLWGVATVVILISILGKGVACMLAARVSGESWRHSTVIGTLMNARGLMELILLNVGLERGVITPTFFTIMVLMAVVTTGVVAIKVMALMVALVMAGRARSGRNQRPSDERKHRNRGDPRDPTVHPIHGDVSRIHVLSK